MPRRTNAIDPRAVSPTTVHMINYNAHNNTYIVEYSLNGLPYRHTFTHAEIENNEHLTYGTLEAITRTESNRLIRSAHRTLLAQRRIDAERYTDIEPEDL